MKTLFLIKLPNGVYFLWDNNNNLSAHTLLFALKGIRSSGKTVVITDYTIGSFGIHTIAEYLTSKGFSNIDRIFISKERNLTMSNLDRTKREMGQTFGRIAKRVLYYDMYAWIKHEDITTEQLEWFQRVILDMLDNKKFLLGQLSDRTELEQLKSNLITMQTKLEKREEELKNLKSTNEVGKTSIKNILRMKWIDKIEATRNNGLRILTKAMACTYVPNIGRYMDVNIIKRHDILYRIFKYQCLGKYFIIQPDYYIIDSNFNIRADVNDRYPLSKVRNVMIRNTYFHGQACHIGNQNICAGELASAISGARKNGLDMLLMSFEAYLRSINLPDAAGQRFYCLPMGDADGNVEVWPFVEDVMKRMNVSFGDRQRNLETYEWILTNTRLRDMEGNFGRPFEDGCRDFGEDQAQRNLNNCLELVKEREPQVYEEIMARVEKGAVL